MIGPSAQQPQWPGVAPMTVIAVLDDHRYRCYWKGAYYEVFAPSAASFSVGDLVMARVVRKAGQLFVPKVSGIPAVYAMDANRKIVYTTAISSAVWQAATASPTNWGYLRLDLTDPNIGYITATANIRREFYIYRNTAIKTGAWTTILDATTFATVAGITLPAVSSRVFATSVVHSVIGQAGLIAVFVLARDSTLAHGGYALHSHDNGTTWTSCPIFASGGSENDVGLEKIVIAKDDPNRIYVLARVSLDWKIYRSDDLGHSFAQVDDGTPVGSKIATPQSGATKVYVEGPSIYISNDRAVTWPFLSAAPPFTGGVFIIRRVSATGEKMIGLALTDATEYGLSTDDGDNYTVSHLVSHTALAVCVLANNAYALTTAGSGGANSAVYTFNDTLALTDVTGNLPSLLGTAAFTIRSIEAVGVPFP